jgi:hypothetical protein
MGKLSGKFGDWKRGKKCGKTKEKGKGKENFAKALWRPSE